MGLMRPTMIIDYIVSIELQFVVPAPASPTPPQSPAPPPPLPAAPPTPQAPPPEEGA